jgi:hypothetical protein
MISFNKPINLDGAKLIDELIAGGVEIIGTDEFAHLGKKPPMIDGSGKLNLAIAEADKEKATAIVAAHNGGN